MSAADRYSKVLRRTWTDSKFLQLSRLGKLTWLYLLSGDSCTAFPGLLRVSPGVIADALGEDLPEVRDALAELVSFGMAKVDPAVRLIWLPNALKHNPPENPSVCRAWKKCFDGEPDCGLKEEVGGAATEFLRSYPDSFMSAWINPNWRQPNQHSNRKPVHEHKPAEKPPSEPPSEAPSEASANSDQRTAISDIHPSAPAPIPQSRDSFEVYKALIAASVSGRLASKFSEVDRLDLPTVESVIREFAGKPQGMMVNRLKDLASLKHELEARGETLPPPLTAVDESEDEIRRTRERVKRRRLPYEMPLDDFAEETRRTRERAKRIRLPYDPPETLSQTQGGSAT